MISSDDPVLAKMFFSLHIDYSFSLN